MDANTLNWVVLGAVVATLACGAAIGITATRRSCRQGISDEEGVDLAPVVSLGLG
jgi:hypothetical protein